MFFHELLYEYPLLSLLERCFAIAMIVHAYRRGAEFWWYYFIFFIPVIGSLAYFFAVVAPRIQWKYPFFGEPKTPVEELEFRAQNSPTFANHFALGARLVELGRYDEALGPLEDARKREPDHSPVCFNLARCLYELHRSNEALPYVQKIIEKEPRWEDYAAWRLLMQIQQDLGLDDAVVETGRQLVKLSPRMEHKYLLGEQLARVGIPGEARLVLENALEEQRYVNGAVARQNRKWVRESKRLLRDLAP